MIFNGKNLSTHRAYTNVFNGKNPFHAWGLYTNYLTVKILSTHGAYIQTYLTVKILSTHGAYTNYLTVKIFPRMGPIQNGKNLGHLSAPQWYCVFHCHLTKPIAWYTAWIKINVLIFHTVTALIIISLGEGDPLLHSPRLLSFPLCV